MSFSLRPSPSIKTTLLSRHSESVHSGCDRSGALHGGLSTHGSCQVSDQVCVHVLTPMWPLQPHSVQTGSSLSRSLPCMQACGGGSGALLAVVLPVEHAAAVRLGQLPAGGRQDLLRPWLVQPEFGEHVLHRYLLPAVLCPALLCHPAVLLPAPADPETGRS